MKLIANPGSRKRSITFVALLFVVALAVSNVMPSAAEAGDFPINTTFPLTVAKSGDGSVDVTSTPAGISCGAACVAQIPAGTKVTLVATPSMRSTFIGWGGACSGSSVRCELTMDSAKVVEAMSESIVPPFVQPHLVKPKVAPAVKKIRRGKTGRFMATVENQSDGSLEDAKLCLKVPRKLIRVKGRPCRSIAKVDEEKSLSFRVKVKPNAKVGRSAQIRFVLSWDTDGTRKTTVARVKIR